MSKDHKQWTFFYVSQFDLHNDRHKFNSLTICLIFIFFSGNWLHSPWFYITVLMQFAVRIRVLITSHDSWSIFTIGPFLLIDASTFNNPVQFHLKMNPWKWTQIALNLKEFSEMSFLEISFCASYTRSLQVNVTHEFVRQSFGRRKRP